MSGKLKYACIGAGGIADKKHLNEYSKLSNVEIVAICDPNPKAAQRLADKYHIANIYDNCNDMFKAIELDLVSICTPNYLHAQMCIDAMQAGINVHCEKPLAINPEEILRIICEKNKSNKKLMVALNNRFTNEAVMIKKLVETNFLGEIYHARCGWKRNSGIPGIGNWFTDNKFSGGGVLIDLGVHYLDMAFHMMGYPKTVSVYGATYSKFGDNPSRIRIGYKSMENGAFNVEDTAVGFVRLENDATIDFDFSWASNIEKEVKFIELLGTRGGVSLKNGELKIFSQQVDTCYTMLPDAKTIPQVPNEFQYFADCIISGNEPSASPEQAYELMKTISAVYKSAFSKKEVVINKS